MVAAALSLGLSVTADIAHAAQAGTATIRVEVTESGRPVAGATVSANGGQPATTDASGVATLTAPPGEVTLVATKDGRQPAKGRVEVAAGSSHTVRLVLEPPITNDGTIVTSTRTNRRADDQAGHERFVAQIQGGLGAEAFTAARTEGQAMPLEQAVADALEDAPDPA